MNKTTTTTTTSSTTTNDHLDFQPPLNQFPHQREGRPADVLEYHNPFDHFRQYGFEPIIADLDIETSKEQMKGLLSHFIQNMIELEEINVEQTKNEYFYALFYNYLESNMDAELLRFYNNIRTWYSSSMVSDLNLQKAFKFVYESKDLNAKKFFMLVMIGSEKNIQLEIRSIYHQNLVENQVPPYLQKIILKKMDRLLKALPKLVDIFTSNMQIINGYNISTFVKDHFLKICIDIYDMGVNIPGSSEHVVRPGI
jgi:hypothetical protein